MKKARIFFVSVIIICLGLYAFTDASFTIYIAGAFIIYALCAFISVTASGRRVKIDMRVAPKAEKNSGLPAILDICSKSFVPLVRCDVPVTAENLFIDSKTGVNLRLSALPFKKKTYEFHVEESFAGCLELSVSEIRMSDPVGIFQRTEKADIHRRSYIFPAISEVPVSKDALLSYDMESFKYSAVRPGADLSEVFDIREYRQGDNIKGIHWKLSGKEGELMVKVPSLPVENSLMIILDKNLLSLPLHEGSEDVMERGSLAEHAAELFLSLSDTLIKQGLSHSAGWYDCLRESFVQKDVFSADDVYSMIPELISSPFREDAMSGADRYIDSDCEKNYAAFIYVTDSDEAEKEVERLREYGEVYIYRPENFK